MKLFGAREKAILTKSEQNKLKRVFAASLTGAVFDKIASLTSPVTGKSFKNLTREYAIQKSKKVKPPIPNLRLEEDMLPSIKHKNTDDGIDWGIFNPREAIKAFNHNTPKSKRNTSPKRQFVPKESETFTGVVRKAVSKRFEAAAKKIIDVKLTAKAKAINNIVKRIKI